MTAKVIFPTVHLDDGRVAGVRFRVELPNGTAQVSILEWLPSIDPSQPEHFREILQQMGSVLTEVAQQPELIQWHLGDAH